MNPRNQSGVVPASVGRGQNRPRVGEQLTRAVAELETTAHTDALTGLPNRRTWDEELPKGIARGRRSSHPLCVALLDLDGLKVFNDTHGHPAADALLRDAGEVWRTALSAPTVRFTARSERGPDWPSLTETLRLFSELRLTIRGTASASSGGLDSWPRPLTS
jgi:predicted signal transduction protein with EAL and GGDEF domain